MDAVSVPTLDAAASTRASGVEDAAAAKALRQQNQLLYGEAGQHNPRLAKAAKRRAKRAAAAAAPHNTAMEVDEDFDFAAATAGDVAR